MKNDQQKHGKGRKLSLKKLEDQVVVIVGATSGIGLATARLAAERGAKVVLAARNQEALEALAEELNARGRVAVSVQADVGREEGIARIAEAAIRSFGGFDTWVNNASIMIFGNALEIPVDDMKKQFDTNYWSVVYGSRTAANHYAERGDAGSIINIGSGFGDRGVVLQSSYAASKFAVHGWTESLRMELEKQKLPVSVTLIHSGRIDTPYNEHARSYLDKQPGHIGMMYDPRVVADAVLFAAAHRKRDVYVGGQAKLLSLAGSAAPRMTDRLMEATLYRTQQLERPSRLPKDSALYRPGYGLAERGSNKGWLRKNSWSLVAQKHPLLASAAIAGAGSVLWKTFVKR
ncbi:SDR family oxidoreductase [Planococcus sp. SSTMD024]|uniref:SDR family oxidoreductase n=1 Tax=Planococcus sp. SSTMD024 TaxID=3242163 RepID=UPI00351E81A9